MAGTILTSSEIANSFAPFDARVSSFAANPFHEQAAGGLMGALGNSIGPLAAGGLGMLGLDPMSIGLRAGTAAFSGGASLAGAAGAGLGFGAAAALPMMAAGYAGNQMMTGMQQQQQLNNTMRSNFRQLGPNGQGFNRSQMGDIGASMREMQHSFGPGGEMASFRELTSMAGQMGAMGMARGVRDVQDFTKKFKEMVDVAKTMARDLGTTLEGAMQAMQGMRGSGVFKAADQMKFSGAARNTALAGGLAMTEVTAMASIGSQISRSVGGLGKAGAFGGMKAIGMIGTAQQTGAISEEDIYNSTGMLGAEGRQAFATNMLSQDAGFLKSGRGRRLLAAIADKDGQLDSGAISEFMSGGMTVGRTMQLDERMKKNVGRANFIRNEGRLRGEFLEKFGGMAKVMAYSQWAGGKGIDISDLSNDRNTLAGMRWTGMGRDEYETSIKMMQNMPQIMSEQANKARDDDYLRNKAEYSKTLGMQGLQMKFQHAREKVNANLQATGAKILEQGSDMVEGWFNKVMGEYVQQTSARAASAYEATVKGDKAAFSRTFGGGSSIVSGNNVGGMNAGGGMYNGFMGKGLLNFSDRKGAFENKGFSFESVTDERTLKGRLGEIADMQLAAGGNVSSSMVKHAAGMGSKLTNFFAYTAGKGGDDTTDKLQSLLEEEAGKGDTNAKALLLEMKKSPTAKAKVLHAASVGSGGDFGEAEKLLGVGAVDPNNVFSQLGGKFRSEGDRRDAYFQAFTGDKRTGVAGRLLASTGGLGGAVAGFAAEGGFLNLRNSIMGAVGGYAAGQYAKEELDKNDALASALTSGKYNDLISDAYSTDPKRRAEAQAKLANESRKLTGMDDNASNARKQILASIDATSTFAALGAGGTDEEAAKILKDKGLDGAFEKWSKKHGNASEADFLRQRAATLKSGLDDDQLAARIQQAGLVKAQGAKDIQSMLQGGMATLGNNGKLNLSTDATVEFNKLDPQSQNIMKQMMEVAQAQKNVTEKTLGDVAGKEASLFANIRNMSVDDQKKAAAALRATGQGRMAAYLESEAATSQRIKKSLDTKGVVGGAAAELGLDIAPERQKAIDAAQKSGDFEKASRLLYAELQGAGLEGGVSTDQLSKLMQHGKKNGGVTEDATNVIKGIQDSDEFKHAKTEKAKKAEEAKNPLMAEVRDLLKDMKESDKESLRFQKRTAANTSTLAERAAGGEGDQV